MGKTIASIFLGFFVPSIVSAQVVITEIMYDLSEGGDTGREWIEVLNTGSESVNVTEWKLFENDTNHGLKAVGGEALAPGAYAIISDNPTKFAVDWPSFNGLVFDSAFSLNNAGETLVLRCCGKEPTDRDSVTYNNTGGGSGDGLSLHRSGSSITAAAPSPGSGAVVAPPPPEPEVEPAPEPSPIVQSTQTKQPETSAVKQVQEPVQKTEEKKVESQTLSQVIMPPAPTAVVQEESEPPPKKKVSKKIIEEQVGIVEEEAVEEFEEEIVGNAPERNVAAAGSSASSDLVWCLGAAAISLFGAGGAYMAGRSQRKKEWQIEEVE